MKWLATMLGAGLTLGLVLPAEVILEGTASCLSGVKTDQIVLYLSGDVPVPTPPDEAVVLDQRKLTFVPKVLPIVVGTKVVFPNSDSVRHNVFSASETRMFNLGIYPPGTRRAITFDRPGVVEVLCNVHPEMAAYVLVLETPYFSMTDQQGRFRMTVPAGDYTLHFWCEHQGEISRRIALKEGILFRVEALLHRNEVQFEERAPTPSPPEDTGFSSF